MNTVRIFGFENSLFGVVLFAKSPFARNRTASSTQSQSVISTCARRRLCRRVVFAKSA